MAWRWPDAAASSIEVHVKSAEELGVELAHGPKESEGLLSNLPGAFTPQLPGKFEGFQKRPGAHKQESVFWHVRPGEEQPSAELRLRQQDAALRARAKAAQDAASDRRARMRSARSSTSFNPNVATLTMSSGTYSTPGTANTGGDGRGASSRASSSKSATTGLAQSVPKSPKVPLAR